MVNIKVIFLNPYLFIFSLRVVGSPRLLIGVNTSFEATRQAGQGPGKAHDTFLVVPETRADDPKQPSASTVQAGDTRGRAGSSCKAGG